MVSALKVVSALFPDRNTPAPRDEGAGSDTRDLGLKPTLAPMPHHTGVEALDLLRQRDEALGAAARDLVRQRKEAIRELGEILREQDRRIQELSHQLIEERKIAADRVQAAEAAVRDTQARAADLISEAKVLAEKHINEANVRAAQVEEQLAQVHETIMGGFSAALRSSQRA